MLTIAPTRCTGLANKTIKNLLNLKSNPFESPKCLFNLLREIHASFLFDEYALKARGYASFRTGTSYHFANVPTLSTDPRNHLDPHQLHFS